MSLRHPRGNTEQAAGYKNLEFREKIQAEIINSGVTNIWVTLKVMRLDKILGLGLGRRDLRTELRRMPSLRDLGNEEVAKEPKK